ncbi:hypothetical protein GW934_02510, partial [Candidatus Falkowbacteria bacterium]|nr:hypothetical protein [Candidatus Falkowbacteria bacterium]
MFYFLVFLAALVLSAVFTFFIAKIARYYKIIDNPSGEKGRKIHKKPTPLLGGLGIFLAYFLLLFILSDRFLSGDLNIFHLLGFFTGALILIIGGALDDKYNLQPARQIIFPLLAILAVVFGGIKISNPLGGVFDLNKY